MEKFINNFTKYKVTANELELYNVNYITKEFRYQEADIIYKIKDKEVYYLVEHQTKVDYSMPYRILNYCIEIIRSVVENLHINRAAYKYPVVIPIVFYTGNQTWTANTSYAESQVKDDFLDYESIDVKYKLIDVNEHDIEHLLKEKTMLSNAMILEKCNNNEDVVQYLKKITQNIENKEQVQYLKRLVIYLYSNMEEGTLKDILKLIEESECDEKMSTIAERLRDEYVNERRKGIAQGISDTIKRMIKMNLENDFIKKATGANEKEIEKIRKEMK